MIFETEMLGSGLDRPNQSLRIDWGCPLGALLTLNLQGYLKYKTVPQTFFDTDENLDGNCQALES